MGHCRDCKHWTRNRKEIYDKDARQWVDVGPDNIGDCSHSAFVEVSDKGEEKTPSNGLGIWNEYGVYETIFETGEDFGCVHFEQRG